MTPHTSRSLLALAFAALALLAGCSAPGSLSMDPVTDAELAEHASRDASRSDGEADRERRLVREAIRNGSATLASPSPPVEAGLPFAFRGAYYNLSWTITERNPATHATVEIDYNASNVSGETVAYADLPPADKRAMDALLPPRYERRTEGYDFGVGVTYTEGERERSVLLSGRDYDAVVYRGTAYPVRVEDTRTITLNTYRYTSTLVANSSAAYAEQLRQQYRFTLAGLSDAERRIVTTAIEDGSYYPESDDDAAFRSLVERFRRHEAVTQETARGEWLVRYNGTDYWVELAYEQFEGS